MTRPISSDPPSLRAGRSPHLRDPGRARVSPQPATLKTPNTHLWHTQDRDHQRPSAAPNGGSARPDQVECRSRSVIPPRSEERRASRRHTNLIYAGVDPAVGIGNAECLRIEVGKPRWPPRGPGAACNAASRAGASPYEMPSSPHLSDRRSLHPATAEGFLVRARPLAIASGPRDRDVARPGRCRRGGPAGRSREGCGSSAIQFGGTGLAVCRGKRLVRGRESDATPSGNDRESAGGLRGLVRGAGFR